MPSPGRPALVTRLMERPPILASRRFVLGAALASAASARAAGLLAPPAADEYVGGRLIEGRGVRTTELDVTDAAFGAKGDGVLLGDLVVRAGDTSISSAVGPFTSTAADRGKLVVWRGADDSVGTGVIEAVQSSTRATLRNAARVTSRMDGGPNLNGLVGTDDTAALDRAFSAAQAAAARQPSDRRDAVPRVEVHLPRGVFVIRTLAPFEVPGVSVRGEGRYTTLVASAADDAWLQLSPYRSTPSDAYVGTAYDWSFQDIQFVNPCFTSGSSEGRRTGRAIQDNGSGGARVLGCSFRGLSYGFCGAYGSDFSTLRDCTFALCDTGYYFGPGSQQLEIDKTDATQCREGAVFEGAPHWHIGGASSFEDPSVAAITIEGRASGTTRLGVPVQTGGAFYSGKFLVDGATWFETDSGGNGRIAPRLVLVDGDGPFGLPVEGLVVRDAYVVAGGPAPKDGPRSFVEYRSALVSEQPVLLEDCVIGGIALDSVFRMTGSATTSNPWLVRTTRPASVALVSGPTAGARVVERDGSVRWPAGGGGAAALSLVVAGTAQPAGAALLGVEGSDGAVGGGLTSQGAALARAVAGAGSGGAVTLDARAGNFAAYSLTGGTVRLSITDPPSAGSQTLVVALHAVGGARSVVWPSDCRFTGGAPTTVAAGTRTTVTLAWHPQDRVWIETARTEGVAA